jgi:hypothetical protein
MQQKGSELLLQATSRLVHGGPHVQAAFGDKDAFDRTFVVVAVFYPPVDVMQ